MLSRPDRRWLAPGERAGDADLDVVAACGQPGDAADVAALHVAGHDVAQPLEPRRHRIHSSWI